MSKTAYFSISSRIGENTLSSEKTITDSGIMLSADATLLAADAGTLSTRTGDDVGTATLSTGHGIITGDIVDMYWSGGAQYNITVGTVATNSVPLSGGAGDVFPIQDTVISISKRTAITFTDVGNNVSAFMVQCNQACRFAFMAAGGEITAATFSISADQGIPWYEGMGYTNPLAGETLVKIEASTSASSDATIKVDILGDVSSED